MKTKLLVLLTVSAALLAGSTALAQTPASAPAAAAPAPDAAALYQRSLESLQAKKIKETKEASTISKVLCRVLFKRRPSDCSPIN